MFKNFYKFFIAFGFLFFFINPAYADYAPLDSIDLKVLSTGTHTKWVNSFINKSNGYKVGDNSPDDGVVTSGDYVAYKMDVNIKAGPERSEYVKFSNGSGYSYLDASDISRIKVSSDLIPVSLHKDGFYLSVPRGVASTFTVYFSVQAKDTGGIVIPNNSLVATLKNDDYVYSVTSDPVTVVSVPLGDLTLDTDQRRVRTFNQFDKYGYLSIVPTQASIYGYSSQGVTKATKWHCKLDVSKFPKGTEFYNGDTKLLVDKGFIDNLSSVSTMTIKYKLPIDALPSSTNKSFKIDYKIIPYDDSFKAGDVKNIKDFGTDLGPYSGTEIVEIGDVKYSSINGVAYPNNNYSYALWSYDSSTIYGYNSKVYIPRDDSKSLNSEANLYFNPLSDWWKQGISPTNGIEFLENNDMYLDMSQDVLGSSDKLIAGATIVNTKDLKVKFDPTKSIVATFDNKVIDPKYYDTYFRTNSNNYLGDNGSKWYESSIGFNPDFNQVKVMFKAGAFIDDSSKQVHIYVPIKALNSYNREDIGTNNSLDIMSKSGFYDHSSGFSYTDNNYYKNTIFLNKLSKPSIVSKVKLDDPIYNESFQRYTVSGEASLIVNNALTDADYNAKRVLTFSKYFDMDTLKYDKKLLSYYDIKNTGDHEITITRVKDNNSTDTPIFKFSIETYSSLKANSYWLDVNSNSSLDYPSILNRKAGSVTSNSSASVHINVSSSSGAGLYADNEAVEIGKDVTLRAVFSSGDSTFETKLVLPNKAQDTKMLEALNKANNSNLEVLDNGLLAQPNNTGFISSMDTRRYKTYGFGRSSFDSYKIKNIHFNNYKKGLEVYIKGERYNIKENGDLDISPDKIDEISNYLQTDPDSYIDIKCVGENTDYQSYNANVSVTITPINPSNDNVFVMWSSGVLNNVPWPCSTKIKAYTLSGELGFTTFTYLDNIPLSLYKKVDNAWVKVASTRTKEVPSDIRKTYHYSFDNLRSGLYKVSVDGVKLDNYGRIIFKDSPLQRGPLYFTYNGREVYNEVGGESQVFDLSNRSEYHADFFYDEYYLGLKLGLSNASVSYKGNYADVGYDITLKNTGKKPIRNIKLTDLLSSDLKNVSFSTNAKVYKEIAPNILGVTPVYYYDTDIGDVLFYTSDSIYHFNPNVRPNIPSKVYSLTGIKRIYPLLYSKAIVSSFFKSSVISPSESSFLIYSDSGIYLLHNLDNPLLAKITGLDGDVKNIYARDAFSFETPGIFYVTTSSGKMYALYNFNSLKYDVKELDIKGDVKKVFMGVNQSLFDPHYSSDIETIVTSKGVYFVDTSNMNVSHVDLDVDTAYAKSNSGYNEGVIVSNSSGMYFVPNPSLSYGNKPILISGTNGNILSYDLFYKHPDDKLTGVIVSDTGVYKFILSQGQITTSKLDDVKGKPYFFLARYVFSWNGVGFNVLTDEGSYTIDNDFSVGNSGPYPKGSKPFGRIFYRLNDEIYAVSFSSFSIDKHIFDNARLFSFLTDSLGAGGGYVITDKGTISYSVLGLDGNISKRAYSDLNGDSVSKVPKYVKLNDMPYTVDSISDNKTTRSLTLASLDPGDEMVIHVKGQALRKNLDYLVGHEVYANAEHLRRKFTSDVYWHTSFNITGKGKPDGVPDDFVLPSLEDYDAGKNLKNPTIDSNTNVDNDLDMASQTIDKIVGMPKDAVIKYGTIKGRAFYDKNGNGLMDDNEYIANISYQVINSDGLVVGEGVTGKDGSYKVSNLPYGNYDVHFNLSNFKYNDKFVETTKLKIGDNPEVYNSIDSSGYSTDKVVVSSTPSIVNLGLISFDSSISVINGLSKNNTDTIYGNRGLVDSVKLNDIATSNFDTSTFRVDDGDNDPRTQGYVYKVVNSGQRRLTNIKVSQDIVNGEKALLSSKLYYYEGENKPLEVSLKDGIVYNGDNPLVMKEGSYLIGYNDIGFTKANPNFKSTIKVSASVLSTSGAVVSSVSDLDSLEVNYIAREDKFLNIELLGDNNYKIAGASVKLYKKVGDDYKYVGNYYIIDGKLQVLLGSGEYKIVQTSTENGYVLPSDDLEFSLSYNKEGNILVSTSGNRSFVTPLDNTWGKITYYNNSSITLPDTGGSINLLALGGLFIFVGLSFIYYRSKKAI